MNEQREGAAAAVSLNDTPRSDHTRKQGPAQATGISRMTAVDGLGRVGERADGTVCSVDAVTGAGIGPYRKSRLKRIAQEGAD